MAVRKFLFGSFGLENDMCAIAALSVLDKIPNADILVTMDRVGATRWAPILASNGIEMEIWAPGDPVSQPIADLIAAEGLRPIPKPIADNYYASSTTLNSACVAYFQYRKLQLYLRGGARLDADALTFSDSSNHLQWRSENEFVVAAYTRTQACCGIVSCRRRHPLLLDWYRRVSKRIHVCEEILFNGRLKRWLRVWPIRFLHSTMPSIFDVRDKSMPRGRKRVVDLSRLWDPKCKLDAPILHYVHNGRDTRIPSSLPYRKMTVQDVLDFPLDGAGKNNIVISRARQIVDIFGLASRLPAVAPRRVKGRPKMTRQQRRNRRKNPRS